jgi:hypothetical protein
MQILKVTGIDLRERRMIGKLYIDQYVKVRLDQGETRNVKTGKGVTQRYCWSPIFFNLGSKYIAKEGLEGFADLCVDFSMQVLC